MTRKTGKVALKARQLARAAKLMKQKQELERAGISMKPEKPSLKALREKDEELKELYLELFPEAKRPAEEETQTPLKESEGGESRQEGGGKSSEGAAESPQQESKKTSTQE